MTDNKLSIPDFLRRPLPPGTSLSQEIARANAAVSALPGSRFEMPSLAPPRKPEVKRYELSDVEAAKLAAEEAKFAEWQASGRPGQGKKAERKKRASARRGKVARMNKRLAGKNKGRTCKPKRTSAKRKPATSRT